MFKEIYSRLKQGYHTNKFPKKIPSLPEKFIGLPKIYNQSCESNCNTCIQICPVNCIANRGNRVSLDLGKCIFCGECATKCPNKIIEFSKDYRLSTDSRNELICENEQIKLAEKMSKKIHKLLGRSLKLRQVSAGGCGACEADINVLNTISWDLGRFGVQIVASPRHADGIIVTGPVPRNMKIALDKTYAAIAHPKIIIAVGACAISGGIFRDGPEACNGLESLMKVDLFIPGCPPHPLTILDGILRLLGKIATFKVEVQL